MCSLPTSCRPPPTLPFTLCRLLLLIAPSFPPRPPCSATNYCGTANNAGAILVLGRDLVMVPKLIHPLPPNTPRTPGSAGGSDEIEEDPPTPHPGISDTWMAALNEERPPTPPRGRPQTHSLETF